MRTAYRPFAYCIPSKHPLNTAFQKGACHPQYWLHWLSWYMYSHYTVSCIMLVYFGFNKLCQKSYSDSQDLPGISRHLFSSFVWFIKKAWWTQPSFCDCNFIYPDPFRRRTRCCPGLPRCSNQDTLELYTGIIQCVVYYYYY